MTGDKVRKIEEKNPLKQGLKRKWAGVDRNSFLY